MTKERIVEIIYDKVYFSAAAPHFLQDVDKAAEVILAELEQEKSKTVLCFEDEQYELK